MPEEKREMPDDYIHMQNLKNKTKQRKILSYKNSLVVTRGKRDY